MLNNPPPSVPQHSSRLHNEQNNISRISNKPSGFTSFMTPNTNTSRTYDAHMASFGVQMGFGAVPSRVTTTQANNTRKRKGSKSRSTS